MGESERRENHSLYIRNSLLTKQNPKPWWHHTLCPESWSNRLTSETDLMPCALKRDQLFHIRNWSHTLCPESRSNRLTSETDPIPCALERDQTFHIRNWSYALRPETRSNVPHQKLILYPTPWNDRWEF
jgi:hypothetical protein